VDSDIAVNDPALPDPSLIDPRDYAHQYRPAKVHQSAPVSLAVRNVSVDYRIFEDSRAATVGRFVSSRFKSRVARVVHAVQDVSFDAHEGEAIALIGRNGSGKTTLLKALGGLLPVAQGGIYARSAPVILGVKGAVHPELSGRRNVFLAGTALGMTKASLEENFDDIVRFAGVEDYIDLPLRAYSSGMSARLQFAVASSVQPDILCIDEALGVGDEEFKEKSNERIRGLTKDAGVVFIVSHNLSLIREMCTRALWLEDGVLISEGDANHVIDQYQNFAIDRRDAGRARDKIIDAAKLDPS
jgi:teichoic acid transport system ATP-binding protein